MDRGTDVRNGLPIQQGRGTTPRPIRLAKKFRTGCLTGHRGIWYSRRSSPPGIGGATIKRVPRHLKPFRRV